MIKKIMYNGMLWILIASTILAFMIVGYARSTGLIIGHAADYQYFPNENALRMQASPDCSHARAYIKEGEYDSRTHVLKLEISNTGKINLSFSGFLTYKNGTLVRYLSSLDNVMAGETMTVEMVGVEPGLNQATIQSKECPEVQDLVYYYDIKGMT
jgi:archaellum component FlaF (FlaF/FlaG flagellin family)